jgi:Cytochrome c554 and c-prime
MEWDTQAPAYANSFAKSQAHKGPSVVWAALIGVVTLFCLIGLGLGLGVFEAVSRNGYALTRPGSAQTVGGDSLQELRLFTGWERPDVVLVLSGEQHGYLQPCGCTSPQYGGLTRRFNLMHALRQRGWHIVAADLGDINQMTGPQAILKYTYAMKALDLMSYTAVNFGEYECSMPLTEALANYSLNNPTPRVVNANLLDRQLGGRFNGTVLDWALADKPPGPKVGIFALTGPSVEQKVLNRDPAVRFGNDAQKIVLDCLRELKRNKAELSVLLYQGSLKEAMACANFCASALKQHNDLMALDVILCVSSASEPPAVPTMVGDTMIVEVGHKGRYVGVVGVFRRNKGPAPFELKYQLVSIEPKFSTPQGQEKGHKLMALMEEYTAELKRDDYLAKFKQVPHPVQVTSPNATYAGSVACVNCHAAAFKIWKGSKHAQAYQTLVDAKNPSLRQYDGECVVCHTVGFGYKTGFENSSKTASLTDVGCESCHGPASEHVSRPNNKQFQKEINPFKWHGEGKPTAAQEHARLLKVDKACQTCHNLDNDNDFQFNLKWPKIVHMNEH